MTGDRGRRLDLAAVDEARDLVRVTGVCDRGEHDQCRGRVYAGHVDGGGVLGARYVSCECECHDVAEAA